MAVIVAARHWCHLWTNKRVLVMSDNSTTVAGVNRGSSRSPVIMKYLRYMFWLSAVYNFRLTAMHIPGADNVLADKISRLHEPYSRHNLSMLLAAEPLAWHMTFNAFVCILHSRNRLVETTNALVDMCLTKLLVKNNQS